MAERKYIKSILDANSEADEVVKYYCNNIFKSYLKGFEANKSDSEISDEIDEKAHKSINDMQITAGYDFQGYSVRKRVKQLDIMLFDFNVLIKSQNEQDGNCVKGSRLDFLGECPKNNRLI